MSRFTACVLASLAFVSGSVFAAYPDRPIKLIVPWGAGGDTDVIYRAFQPFFQKHLGGTIVIANIGGASGTKGAKEAKASPADGYTIFAVHDSIHSTYWTGVADVDYTDFEPICLVSATPSILTASPKAPWKDVKALVADAKKRPGQITVATAGVTSAGHNAMDFIVKATGVKYKEVSYDGGNPAVVATVSGEADLTTQLAVEEADMIRGKRLRPLATVSDKPLELEGYGVIPPLSDFVPGFTAPANYFGIFIPKGVPDEVIKTLEKIWAEQIVKSDALKKYATSRGALFNPLYGEAAQKAVFPAIQANAWVLFEGGKAKVKPDTVGIPKP